MLAAVIKAALLCVLVQSAGGLALGATCWDGRLPGAESNSSCTVLQPFLMFCHGKSVHRMGLDGRHHRRLAAGLGSSIFLDFHVRERQLYWADRRTGVIYKASVQGARRQKLSSTDKHVSGLAVDWVGNSVYWTSSRKGEIKNVDTNGETERTILRHLSQPRLINVDPAHRFLFWLCGGRTSGIQRSDLTGQSKVTVVELEEQLGALTIDRRDKRLFWVQFGLRGESAIGSCDYRGNSLHILDLPLQTQSLGMSVFLENIYYTDAATRTIKKINKYTGGEPVDVNPKAMVKAPVDVKVVHPLIQPTADASASFPGCNDQAGSCLNVCSRLEDQGVCRCAEGFALSRHGTHCEDVNECAHWNHGCSLGCENVPGSYFCTCPKGYTLLPDRKTCQEITACEGNATKCGHGCVATENGAMCVCPEGSVLREDGHACSGCSSADRGGCSQLCAPVTPTRWRCACLPGYRLHQDGKRCSATGPPAFLIVANLMDVRRMDPDGTEEQTLVKEPRGTILAVDYDPVHHHVYFASTSQKTIERVDVTSGSRRLLISDGLESPEGLAIDWVHRRMYWTDKSKPAVDSSSLDGLDRKTVVKEGLQKPRGIAVHPQEKRKLFWTDTGAQPAVESATLEGSGRAVLASGGLVSPTGLTIDFTDNRLFWCDQTTGLIETAALDGSDRRILVENQVGRPFDLAVFEDRLWISEWEHQQIRSVHKRTGRKLQGIHGSLVQPAAVVVVHPLAKPGTDACLHLNGGCAQECESSLGFSRCSCLPGFILAADGRSCLSVSAADASSDSGESKTSDSSSVKNQTLNEESTPPTGANRKADFHSDGDSEAALFTEKMIADQNDCYSLHCAANAKCLLDAGKPSCLCGEGFTGDGQTCVALETPSPKATSESPVDATTRHHNSISAQKCPPSYDAYCLYQGVCVYFPQMDTYACNCVRGYMGERCQFSDLEWLELQQAEKQKERNLAIAGCTVVLIIAITACVAYCFRTGRLFIKQSSEDSVSEISVSDESMSETTTTTVPRNHLGCVFRTTDLSEDPDKFYMVTEHYVDNEAIQPHPGRAVSLSSTAETDYESTMLSAATADTSQPTAHHSRPSLSSSNPENLPSVKAGTRPSTPSPESGPS
ncbi:pro-epidermal growth factor isoform X3 [Fundulus heteroclitus]|uniref:pro-epidermal growth factor isoform X3 n=1 Tax=Fundulus heteroclitus TaxID=8078 RepID=UPI00165ADF2E|nr:pro-epidermal growth factor isoform X3 [Fundulus heteroclitus]